jgi:hypothetical protein
MTDTPATRNVYYTDPAKFDLAKMRAEAALRARGDQLHEPATTIIHFHAAEGFCKGTGGTEQQHEMYPAIFGEEK